MSNMKKSKFVFNLSAFDVKMLDNVVKSITNICKTSSVKYAVIPNPTEKHLFTLLKSPFIYTTSRHHLMYKKHRRSIFLDIIQPGQLNELFKEFQIPDGIHVSLKQCN